MNKEKCIELLNDLTFYIEEEWDPVECSEKIKLNIEALEYAIRRLETSTSCGELDIDGKKYLVCKPS